MKKQTAYIFAAFIVVLLILAIVIMWLTGGIGGDTPEASTEPGAATASPRQTQFVIPTETPEPTATPAVTPTPEVTPTPVPTPEPPSGTVIGSGSFDSASGVGINTHTVWTAAEQSDGSVRLSLSVYVRSYTVQVGQRAIGISVGGSSASGITRAISVDAPNAQTDTLIYTYTATVERGSTINVSVDWNYKGQYSGKDIDVISSETSISL